MREAAAGNAKGLARVDQSLILNHMPNSGMIRGCSSRLLTHVRGGRSIKQQRSVSLSDSPGDLFATPEVSSSYCASRNFHVHSQKQEFWTRL